MKSFPIAGFDGREHYLASHMMAIHIDYRDRGIGKRLELEQRLWAIAYVYCKIVWTYDPFETRNAYLNVSRLGGYVGNYIPSFYGTGPGWIPSNRFLVEWGLLSIRVEEAIAAPTIAGSPDKPNWNSYPRTIEGV